MKSKEIWIEEKLEIKEGRALKIRITKSLEKIKSELQEIEVVESQSFGKILLIDGVIMLTEADEFCYHEMIAHVPLLVHPRPSNILIIGGGDGGTLREVIKHPEVETVHICEIDRDVIDACRRFLPSLASSFDDERVKVFYEDGAEFIKRCASPYDVIIVDSTDPLGPGQALFQRKFYEDMKNALKEDGIAVTQCESIYLHERVIKGVYSFAKEIYNKLGYYYTLIPTYPSGIIGFFFCSLRYDPLKDLNYDRAHRLKELRYYTPELHKASFVLPLFAKNFFTT